MKILHSADLHLDSPLRGLSQYDGAPVAEVRMATRRAFSALIEHCLEESVRFLLIAGDLYDGDFKDYATALFFVDQVARLRESGTRVIWLRGNHDAANKMTRHLQVAEHVHELSVDQPESLAFEAEGCVFHGQGYPLRDVQEDLSRSYPAPLSGLLNFGLLHTALDGRPGHAPYAPCSLNGLRSHGYDYWALGHVHQQEVLSEDPWVVFSGNLQGRHIKESGPKGAMEVMVEAGRIQSVEPVTFDQVRWKLCEVRLDQFDHLDDVLDECARQINRCRASADGRLLSTRVKLLGRTSAHSRIHQSRARLENELRARCLDLGDVYLESIKVATESEVTAELLQQRRDALGDLFRAFEEAGSDPDAASAFWDELLRPLSSVSGDLLRDESIDRKEIMQEAARLLESRLLHPEEAHET